MYYVITNNQVKKTKFENISFKQLSLAYIDIIELENIYKKLKLDRKIITECKNSNTYSKSNFEIYDDYYFATINIKNSKNINKELGKIGIIIKKNIIIIINILDNQKHALDNKISNMINHIEKNITLDYILSMLINISIDGFFDNLQYLENKIINIEKELLKRDISSSLNILIYSIKKELSLCKRYLENILYFIQNIQNIDEKILNTDNLKYINNLENKITRLISTTQYLIENTIHLRDMYQASLDFYQNRVIKLLTVITTIFLPLSLITAWYGMNFKYMPELNSKYGYPIVIAISITIIIICLIFFKRKKIL